VKRFILVLITISTCYLSAFSQIHFGPKVGFLVAKPSFDQFSGNEYRSNLQPGFQVGGMLFMPVTENFGLQTELLYQRKGKNIYGQDLYEHISNSHYLDLPILFNLTQGNKSFSWYVGVGGTLSYWLGGGGKIAQTAGESVVEYSYNFNENLPEANRYQIGLTINGGTRFEVADDRHIQLDVRYEIGHTYMAKEKEMLINDFTDNMLYSNQVVSISAAYLFTHFKKKQRLKSHTYDAKKRGN